VSDPTRGRRNPPDLPPLARLTWQLAAKAVYENLLHMQGQFDSLPAPHADMHHFGNSDELSEFGDSFLVLGADPLLPNARVFQVDGTTLQATDSGGVYLVVVKDAGISNAKLRDSAARSVIGRSAATAGTPGDIVASADGQLLQRAGDVVVFAAPPPPTVVTPAALTANTDNYAGATAYYVRISSTGAVDLTGIVAEPAGTTHVLVNVGANAITLKHQVTSTAVNRFLNSTGADIVLAADAAADVFYDGNTTRWRVFAR
jgi:hypothetical protein